MLASKDFSRPVAAGGIAISVDIVNPWSERTRLYSLVMSVSAEETTTASMLSRNRAYGSLSILVRVEVEYILHPSDLPA